MGEFITNWWPILLTVLAGAGVWGVTQYRLNALEKFVDNMNQNGSNHSRENVARISSKLTEQDRRIGKGEDNTDILIRQVSEMSGDVKAIKLMLERQQN